MESSIQIDTIWIFSQENLSSGSQPVKGADQTALMRSLIYGFAVQIEIRFSHEVGKMLYLETQERNS